MLWCSICGTVCGVFYAIPWWDKLVSPACNVLHGAALFGSVFCVAGTGTASDIGTGTGRYC